MPRNSLHDEINKCEIRLKIANKTIDILNDQIIYILISQMIQAKGMIKDQDDNGDLNPRYDLLKTSKLTFSQSLYFIVFWLVPEINWWKEIFGPWLTLDCIGVQNIRSKYELYMAVYDEDSRSKVWLINSKILKARVGKLWAVDL